MGNVRSSTRVSREMAKAHLPQSVGERYLTGEIFRLPGADFRQQRRGIRQRTIFTGGESNTPLIGPVVRFDWMPAVFGSRQTNQVARSM